MSAPRAITHEALEGLVAELADAGTRIVAPGVTADGGIDYRSITRLDEAVLDGEMPRRSLRAYFQPPTELIFTWSREEGGFRLEPARPASEPWVVLGARPCDAAGAEAIDQVMGWDTRDDLWFARRESAVMIGLACRGMRPSCFCESVGLGPASTVGSDLLLHQADEGYRMEVVTPKGEAFVVEHAGWFTEGAPIEPVPASREALDMDAVRDWLGGHFDDDLWLDLSLRCLGCGACTSICPTCHCFDLVDEQNGTSAGARRRNWDTCQAGLFTLHASGHNPRPDQTSRCRQRILHKFHVYPTRFGRVLCTGCGRCVSVCPAGVNVPEILDGIARRAAMNATAGEPA